MDAMKFRPRWNLLLIILSISLTISYLYFTQVNYPYHEKRMVLHNEIISNTAPGPYQYRILVPYAAQSIISLLDALTSDSISFFFAYILIDTVSIFLLLSGLFFYLSFWFKEHESLLGVMAAALAVTFTVRNQYFQPWSFLEVALLVIGLILIYTNRFWLLLSLLVFATLNRETAVFIPVLFFVINFKGLKTPLKTYWQTALLFAVWFLIFFGLRLLLGIHPDVISLTERMDLNWDVYKLALSAGNILFFFSVFWIFAALGFFSAPTFLKRAVLVVPLYMLTVFFYGIWNEIRLLMPLIPLIIPLAMWFMYNRPGINITAAQNKAYQPEP